MAVIEQDQRIKVYSQNADKSPVGFGIPSDVVATGNSGLKNVLGDYGLVLVRYNIEPAALPDESKVFGDTNHHLFEFKSTGDFTIDPEGDTYDGFGESSNWIDITVKEQLREAINTKVAFLWNTDISGLLAHPVSMFGSDGQLYNSVSGGNLNDDPTNGDTANWQLFLDPSAGVVFPGAIFPSPVGIVPNGYLSLDGTAKSKALFPELYTFLQDGTGACIYGETPTDFTLPDYRGQFIRGWDNGRGLDPAAAGFIFSGDTTNGNPTITNLSSVALIEEGMEIEGTGIVTGTLITSIDYPNNTIDVSPNPTATNSGVTITGHSRKDRGDGTQDDAVGTPQTDVYKTHDHPESFTNPDYTRYQTLQGASSGGDFTAWRDTQTSTTTGGGVTVEDNGSNTETRPKNINAQFIIKT